MAKLEKSDRGSSGLSGAIVQLEEKQPQSAENGIGDVVDKISSAHLSTTTQQVEAKATIGIIRVPDRTCGRIDDALQVGEVLYGWCGHGSRGEDDAGDKHYVK